MQFSLSSVPTAMVVELNVRCRNTGCPRGDGDQGAPRELSETALLWDHLIPWEWNVVGAPCCSRNGHLRSMASVSPVYSLQSATG